MRAEIQKMKQEKAAAPPRPTTPKKEPKNKGYNKGSVLGNIDLDEESGVPIGEQLQEALVKNAGRVIDLFREWDADGDGEVSRKEFHKAMGHLGLEVPKREIDKLFDSWDKDGGGSLDFKELQKILRAPPPPKKSIKGAAKALEAAKALSAGAEKKE